MFKLRKEKLLVSLIVIAMVVLAVGNVRSLATAPTITATNTVSALSNNSAANIGATNSVSATTNSSNNTAKNTNTNSTNTNTESNANKANTATNSSNKKLPYAGTNETVIFVVIALAASAIYAYKKVSDYNI